MSNFVNFLSLVCCISVSVYSVTLDELIKAQDESEKYKQSMQQEKYKFRNRPLKIVDEENPIIPKLNRIVFNTSEDDLSTCIITYASINSGYNNFIKEQIESLQDVGYKGHYLYRIGGWPNMEQGDLKYLKVPYGFKFCALKEAYDMGYKQVLWVDSICIATGNLSELFDRIKKQGCIYRLSFFKFERQCNKSLIETLNVSDKETKQIKHIASGVIGFDFTSEKIQNLFKKLYESLEYPIAFYSDFPEQLVMSVILYRLGLDNYHCKNLVSFSSKKKKNYFFNINYNRKRK